MTRAFNPPLSLHLEPSPGSDIADCYDHAATLAVRLGCVVNWDFNDVFCGVRPSDVGVDGAKEVFLRNFQREVAKKGGCKICYPNP